MTLTFGYDSFVNGEFVPKSTQTNAAETWKDLKPLVHGKQVLLVDFDQTLFQETWFDNIWSEEWSNHAHFGSATRLQHCESTLHGIMRQYMESEMNFDFHENLLRFLEKCRELYSDELVILIWTARDKTVHDEFVPKVMEDFENLIDGYVFCRAKKVEAVEYICSYGPTSLCAFDDRQKTLTQIDNLQAGHTFPISTVLMKLTDQMFDMGKVFGESRAKVSEVEGEYPHPPTKSMAQESMFILLFAAFGITTLSLAYYSF